MANVRQYPKSNKLGGKNSHSFQHILNKRFKVPVINFERMYKENRLVVDYFTRHTSNRENWEG